MIRLFQFKNNFLSEDPTPLSADYCIIGYFDGLNMKTDENMEMAEKIRLLSDPSSYDFNQGSACEMCDYFNIVGLRDQPDADFWRNSKDAYVFISCLRLEKKSENLKKMINEIEKTYQAVCYTTIGSSDLVVCLLSTNYAKGYNAIENYHSIIASIDPDNRLQKGFSMLAIHQESLNNIQKNQQVPGINIEVFSCVLRGVIKSWDDMDAFLRELERKLNVKTDKVYGLLGSEDIMIFLDGVDSLEWLKLYEKDGLMTHTNPLYKKAFYNIRTEILARAGQTKQYKNGNEGK